MTPDGTVATRTLSTADLAGPGGVLSYPLTIQGFRYDYTDEPGSGPLTLNVLSVEGDQGAAPAPPIWGVKKRAATEDITTNADRR